MPIYEYRCPKGHVFETFHRMDDPAPSACEICADGPLERVLHPVAVHFKGSGFYATDYGKGGSRRQVKESSGSDSKSSGSDSSSSGESVKSENKPKQADSGA